MHLIRFELLLEQIRAVESERGAMFAQQQVTTLAPVKMLLAIKSIESELAANLWLEVLFRHFDR